MDASTWDVEVRYEGESLQRLIIERQLARAHVLGILPRGTGKSLCYQLLALIRYERIAGTRCGPLIRPQMNPT